MTHSPPTAIDPQQLYDHLMVHASGHRVEDILARMLASWALGQGAMPRWLGLEACAFEAMLQRHFPGLKPGVLPDVGVAMDPRRLDEVEDLRKLLMQGRTQGSDTEAMMADLLVAGCMGDDHLWQDLGLWNRKDLSRLMLDHFAPLATRNVHDMKWKKFLYKQLCETEGIYTCRAPSCEVCADYNVCFGPEE